VCRWFNVGDSRAYLFDGALRQVSRDHVPPTTDGRRTHSVTQSLGGKPVFQEIWPACGHFNLRPGDSVLLCSDGLTDVLPDSEIAAVLAEGLPGSEIVARLLSSCLSQGAPDNVTVLLAALA
jgi:protein phosphatase